MEKLMWVLGMVFLSYNIWLMFATRKQIEEAERIVKQQKEKKGQYYFVKLRKGVVKTPELMKRIDDFINSGNLDKKAGPIEDLSDIDIEVKDGE